jgi:integrase
MIGFMKKKEYRFRQRKNRKIEVLFLGSETWVSTGRDDENEAIIWAEANKALYQSGRAKDPYLKDYAKDFFSRRDDSSIWKTHQRRKQYFKNQYYELKQARVDNYILPALGKYRLSQITTFMVDSFFISLKNKDTREDLADDTKNKVLLTLSQIFDEAIRTEVCLTNPCDKVKAITAENKARLPMDEDEMEKLFPKEDQRVLWVWGGLMWSCYFTIMKCTGFRPGEVAGLKVENYYQELGGVYTSSSVDSIEKKLQDTIKTSKRGKKYKVGLLDGQTNRLLARYIETLPPDQELLFLVNGGLVTLATSNKHFKLSLSRAGVPLKGRSQYSLRHTFQTTIAGRIEREKILDLMGHTGYREEYDHRDGKRKLEQLQSIRPIIDSIV